MSAGFESLVPKKKKPGQMTELLMFGAPEMMKLGTGKKRFCCSIDFFD